MQSEANSNVYHQILVHEMNWKRPLRFLFFVGRGGGGWGGPCTRRAKHDIDSASCGRELGLKISSIYFGHNSPLNNPLTGNSKLWFTL